jgi:hypothetical protein
MNPKLLVGAFILLGGASCSNEAPTFNAGTGGATGGTGGGGGSSGSVVGEFDGYTFLVPCNGGASSGYDCSNAGCTAGSVTVTKQFPIGGTPGTVYDVTFHAYGVVEGYRYDGGTRDQGTTLQMQVAEGNDLFHRGGMQLVSGSSGYDYNTMQLDVFPEVTGEANRYFFNSIPVPPGDPSASHLTFIIDYMKTIKITGGGMLTFSSFDSNCRLVMNCEKSSTNMCMMHWTVPGVASAMPPPPASFAQPFTNGTGQFGQWMHIDVTDIVPAT